MNLTAKFGNALCRTGFLPVSVNLTYNVKTTERRASTMYSSRVFVAVTVVNCSHPFDKDEKGRATSVAPSYRMTRCGRIFA